jgi:hypothetical protein
VRDVAGRGITAVLWIGAVLLIAAGGAGVLAGIDHPPGTPSRAELTWDADRRLSPELDQVAADLITLSTRVDALGDQGRRILAAVAGRNQSDLSAAIEAGTELQAEIQAGLDSLRASLESMPVTDRHATLRISLSELARHQLATEAVDAPRGIDDAWNRLTSGASAAGILAQLLADHDATMATAAEQGRSQDYGAAVSTIADALALLDQATVLRNQLATTSDVSTLDQWLRRNRTFDEALSDLYVAFRGSNGFVTQEVAAAFARQEAARAQLPPDSRGLVLIMSELSQGGLNQAVIAIEQAGQRMIHALEVLPDSGGTTEGSAIVGEVAVPGAAAGG